MTYEARIHDLGEVPTRADNWHDLFNALAWLAYPRTKRELNRLHQAQGAAQAGPRNRMRDALTLLDESGVLVACADPSLGELLKGFRWKALFWERRQAVMRDMRVFLLGHGLMEQALHPHAGITGKALILDCPAELLAEPSSRQREWLDVAVAQWLRQGGLESTRQLSPLPLLGVPGWDAGNDSPGYYDNAAVFRPGRRGAKATARARA